MQDHKLFAWRVGLVGFSKFLNSFKGVFLLPILSKNLSIVDYGVWAQVIVTIGIVPNLMGLGFPGTMVRFLPSIHNRDIFKGVFFSFLSIVIITGMFASLIIYLFSFSISGLLFGGNIFVVKVLAILVFFETVCLILFNYFRVTDQIKKHSFLLSLKDLLLVFFVSFFVLGGGGINEALLGLLGESVLIFLVTAILIVSQIGIGFPDFHNLKEYLNYGLPLIPSNMSQWVTNSSDRYVIGGVLGTKAVGYYSPGYTLGIIVRIFVEPLNFMLPMVLSQHYDKGNLDEVKKYLGFSLKYFFAVGIPAAFGLSVLSKTFLQILSTPEIAEQGYIITPFVAFGALFFGIFSIFQKVLLLVKETRIIGTIWAIAAIVNLLLNILLVPFIGIVAAAFTTLLSYSFILLLFAYYSQKYLNFSLSIKFMVKCICCSLLMSGIIILWNPVGSIDTFFVVIICALFYFVLLYLLKGFDGEELKFFRNILSP